MFTFTTTCLRQTGVRLVCINATDSLILWLTQLIWFFFTQPFIFTHSVTYQYIGTIRQDWFGLDISHFHILRIKHSQKIFTYSHSLNFSLIFSVTYLLSHSHQITLIYSYWQLLILFTSSHSLALLVIYSRRYYLNHDAVIKWKHFPRYWPLVAIEEFSPIVDKISKNMSHGMIVGDFNINLLQIQEREKIGDFFDLMCVNGFLPKITFPTRFAKKSCSLIDQIFCRFPESHINFSSAIIMSMISDHNPCIVSVNLLKVKSHNPKFVKKKKFSEIALNSYREELMNCERLHQIDNDLSTDPNTTFNILNQALMEAKDKHFPEQVMRFNKYKHKLNKWITAGILKSLQYRDKLYKNIQLLSPESAQYDMAKLNLKAYNDILNRSIRIA